MDLRWKPSLLDAICPPVLQYDRALAVSAAQSILDQGGWCILERCIDISRPQWEPRILVFGLTPGAVADAIEEELEYEPEHHARLAGCDRRTLRPDAGMGAYLCYLAASPAPRPRGRQPARALQLREVDHDSRARRNEPMWSPSDSPTGCARLPAE